MTSPPSQANRRRRRIAIAVAVLVIGLSWWFSPRSKVESIALKNSPFRVRLLKVDAGTLTYSSDDAIRRALRPRLPYSWASHLGPVTEVPGHTARTMPYAGPQLLALFQLTDAAGATHPNKRPDFERLEFVESTGFLYSEQTHSTGLHGSGTRLFQVPAFPRRDPVLRIRAYETDDLLLHEWAIPNPGYRPDYPVWTPEPLPITKTIAPVTMTLKSLFPFPQAVDLSPKIESSSEDRSWADPYTLQYWTDATGNSADRLSPFESAWKLHVRTFRRGNVTFPSHLSWTLDPVELPPPATSRPIDRTKVVDGISLTVRYAASAGEVSDEDNTYAVAPSKLSGLRKHSVDSASSVRNGKEMHFARIDCGVPTFRVEHDPLPDDVRLVCRVRDQNGAILNKDLPIEVRLYSDFCLVMFQPHEDTMTVQLELCVNRALHFEFVVQPPLELRSQTRRPRRR